MASAAGRFREGRTLLDREPLELHSETDLYPFLLYATLPDGWRAHYMGVTGSTNDDAREAARRGEPGLSAFVADEQTAGRGRQGRTWTAPWGFGLLFTLLFRPTVDEPPLRYTMLASVAVAETLEALGLWPAIKWPNDVLLDGRKVAGILAEAFQVETGRAVVMGCGLNVGDAAGLPDGLPPTATSIGTALGRRVHRGELLVNVLSRLEGWRQRPLAELRAAWSERLWGRDQTVRALEDGEELSGTIAAIDDDGTLTLRLPNGELRRLISGELLP
jgi:BirA family biotin operon repressor/biotin-[acetyl-CoA-carboxylase] ligase